MKRSIPPWLLVVIVTLAGGGALLACADTSGTERPTETTPAAPPAPRNGSGAAVAAAGGSSRCEELGALSATALSGALDAVSLTRDTSFMLPNRPAPTKAKVVAVGSPAELVGNGAVLGAGVNASYATCSHCMVVAIGCTATSCADATLFFPRTGTATFTALAQSNGQPFAGTFTDVELEQVTVDKLTFVSTPVVNGACMHISSLRFGATLSSAAPPPIDGGGTSTSSSGGTDGGSDSGIDSGFPSSSSTSSGKSSTSSGGDTAKTSAAKTL